MANLTASYKTFAFSDSTVSNNPLRKQFDSSRSQTIPVSSPGSKLVEGLPADAVYLFFDGTVASDTAADTGWTVSLGIDENRYRFSHAAGTAPSLRSSRALTLFGSALQIDVNVDSTVTMSIGGGGTWGSVVAGDTVFIPGPVTGDLSTPFSVLNQGFWTVLAVLSSTSIQCSRPSGNDFSASIETQTLTDNAQVQAWSAAGVQPGDSVDISAGFSTTTRRTMVIDRVTPTWFEVFSTVAIPLEIAKVPGVNGLIFYSNAKRYVRIEADQEIGVRPNGISTDLLRIVPVQAGDSESVGWFEIWGPIWSLAVHNKSSQPANIQVYSAE